MAGYSPEYKTWQDRRSPFSVDLKPFERGIFRVPNETRPEFPSFASRVISFKNLWGDYELQEWVLPELLEDSPAQPIYRVVFVLVEVGNIFSPPPHLDSMLTVQTSTNVVGNHRRFGRDRIICLDEWRDVRFPQHSFRPFYFAHDIVVNGMKVLQTANLHLAFTASGLYPEQTH
ncbi:MAG: hypothetical protein HY377_01160 [Candidatus Blackburnbacteria bacterium]|nr:hypothetical protein [Candidatus Blackburnbacteria bacterium]